MIDADIKLMQRIASIGNKYFREHDDLIFDAEIKANPDILKSSFLKSAELYFKHMFLRGRRDAVSITFYNRFIGVFRDKLRTNSSSEFKATIQSMTEFDSVLKDSGLNNHKDIDMVINSLNFLAELEDANVTNFVLNSEIESVYSRITKIAFVGDKLASFYLRNIYKIFNRELSLQTEKFYFLPVDTWIGKVSYLTGITSAISSKKFRNGIEKKYATLNGAYSFVGEDNGKAKSLTPRQIQEIKKATIRICNEHNIDAVAFNQGAWCIGFYSFPIVLSILDDASIDRIKFALRKP